VLYFMGTDAELPNITNWGGDVGSPPLAVATANFFFMLSFSCLIFSKTCLVSVSVFFEKEVALPSVVQQLVTHLL